MKEAGSFGRLIMWTLFHGLPHPYSVHHRKGRVIMTEDTIRAIIKEEVMAMVNQIIASFRQQQPLSRTDLEALVKSVIPECYHDAPSGYGGYLRYQNGFMEFSIKTIGSSGTDYDMYFVGGRKYLESAITGTYTGFLQISADGSAEWVAAMPDVMDEGTEVYDVTKNHIHITGATAGNI